MSPTNHNITCSQFVEGMMDFLDLELPEEKVRIWQRHQRSCADCRVFMNSYRTTVHLVRCLGAEDPAELDEPAVSTLDGLPPELIRKIVLAGFRQQERSIRALDRYTRGQNHPSRV